MKFKNTRYNLTQCYREENFQAVSLSLIDLAQGKHQ